MEIDKIKLAGEKAYEYGQNFHCSESAIRAINDVFELGMPEIVLKLATGFRGGGGGYGDRCGILEVGIIAFSYLYGRFDSKQDCSTVSYLVRILHKRFIDELGSYYCRFLRPFHDDKCKGFPCLYVYRKGTELVASVLIEAEELIKNMTDIDKKECRLKKEGKMIDS